MEASNQRKGLQVVRIENPFTLKVGQVFTGFGIGCGVGIGVGRPLNLSAIPVMNQVMSATRGATDAFSGVSWHVNNTLRRMGAKNVEVGIGCGVGIGHGFGIGLAVKPGVVQKIQASFIQMILKMMTKSGVANLPLDPTVKPLSLQSGRSTISEDITQIPLQSISQPAAKHPDMLQGLHRYGSIGPNSHNGNASSKSSQEDLSFGRTEKVISSFLQNPILKDNTNLSGEAGRLKAENSMLQMVLKHQQIIEELMEENEKLRQILVEDLKISPSRLQSSHTTRNKTPCDYCFECRRKQRKNR
uniref:Uncharacterized protein LOC8267951 isoform X1 n=2 Tax=Rhizophora mucronata TaxID=61149 RepID=A0A2P2JB85_RHIMU